MEESERTLLTGDADHLCVLVHGYSNRGIPFSVDELIFNLRLWGNPAHMWYIESALRDKYAADRLHILVPKGNAGNFTYDGIELGAERVTQEIESFLEQQESEGKQVKKLSIVGYSLGGLVARYAIGLLYSRGWFSKIEPINFTTFATPHLGVRTPGLGVGSRFFNALGSRTLSTSGRQLFTIDTFRDTKRPILSILADPSSIFIQALSKFENRVLYANIINDRSAPYYTTSISSTDPFIDLEVLNLNHHQDYSPNILDLSKPFSPKEPSEPQPLYNRLAANSQVIINGLPLAALLSIALPVATVAFLINSGIQSVRSSQRIRLHEAGKSGIGLGSYRVPLMIENARSAVAGAMESINTARPQEYLRTRTTSTSTFSEKQEDPPSSTATTTISATKFPNQATTSSSSSSKFPPLALTDEQLTMIKNLNEVGFRKYLVHIQEVRHSHAAIIVRSRASRYAEGKVVVKHWLEEEFEI